MQAASAARSRLVNAGSAVVQVELLGAGYPVVLIPSLGRSASDFNHLATTLADAGYWCISLNVRGVAGSTGPLEGATLHDLAADVAITIEALHASPAHVVGHAFGNRIARCLAASRPELVETLTLLAAGGLVEGDPQAIAAMKRVLTEDLSPERRRELAGESLFAPESDPAAWTDGWWLDTAMAHVEAARQTARDTWWETVDVPTLVVQGLQDRLAPPENGRALKASLGSQVTLLELEAAGHALLPERPEAIARAVQAHLDRYHAGRLPDAEPRDGS